MAEPRIPHRERSLSGSGCDGASVLEHREPHDQEVTRELQQVLAPKVGRMVVVGAERRVDDLGVLSFAAPDDAGRNSRGTVRASVGHAADGETDVGEHESRVLRRRCGEQ